MEHFPLRNIWLVIVTSPELECDGFVLIVGKCRGAWYIYYRIMKVLDRLEFKKSLDGLRDLLCGILCGILCGLLCGFVIGQSGQIILVLSLYTLRIHHLV
jgi:hypothetical protein